MRTDCALVPCASLILNSQFSILNSQFKKTLNSKNMKKYLRFMEDAAYEVFRYCSIPGILLSTLLLAVLGEFPVWVVKTAKQVWRMFHK